VSFDNYFMNYPPHSCHTLSFVHYITTNFTVQPVLCLSARCSLTQIPKEWYPMHMRLDGASKTPIRLIDGVFLSYHLIQCKNKCQRQQSNHYSAWSYPRPPTAVPPQNQSAESADEVDCVASRRQLWMAVVRIRRRVDGSSMVSLSCGSFDRCFSGPNFSFQKIEVFSPPFLHLILRAFLIHFALLLHKWWLNLFEVG